MEIRKAMRIARGASLAYFHLRHFAERYRRKRRYSAAPDDPVLMFSRGRVLIADLTDNLQYFTFGFAADIKSRAGTNASWLQEHSVEIAGDDVVIRPQRPEGRRKRHFPFIGLFPLSIPDEILTVIGRKRCRGIGTLRAPPMLYQGTNPGKNTPKEYRSEHNKTQRFPKVQVG